MTTENDLVTQAKALFRASAEELERQGWHQGGYYAVEWDADQYPPQYCPACTYGAMVRVGARMFVPQDEYSEVDDVFYHEVFKLADEMLTDEIGMPIGVWNDYKGRTADEAVNLLKKLGN